MVDRDDFGQVLGVLAGMIGAAVSWAAGLGVVTILFSVGIGSLLTYLVSMKTQKNTWKREATFRKVDDIYGPLYFELNKISQSISQDSNPYAYRPDDPNQPTWESIRAGYKYYLVDPPLRRDLDGFFELLGTYRQNIAQRWSIVEEKLLPQLRNAYGQDVQAAGYQVAATLPNGTPVVFGAGTLDGPIMAGEHPLEFAMKQSPNYRDPHLELSLQRAGATQFIFTAKNPDPILSSKFDGLIKATIDEFRNDSRIVLIGQQRKTLMAQADSLKEILRIKTEEPWKV